MNIWPPSSSTFGLFGLALLISIMFKAVVVDSASKLPGPRLLKHTKLPFVYRQLRLNVAPFIEQLHKEYGPVVQVGPKHVSVYGVEGARDVFAVTRRLDRPYPLAFFHNYETENLVSTVEGDVHQERRRPIRNIYSAKVAESDDLSRVVNEAAQGLLAHAGEEMESAGRVELRPWLQSALHDIMSFVVYGAGGKTNLLGDPEQRSASKLDIDFQHMRLGSVLTGFMFLFPHITLLLRKWDLAPKGMDAKIPFELLADRVGRRALQSLKNGDRPGPGDHEGLMHRLYAHFEEHGPSNAVPSMEYILSDSLDHFWAGINTTLDALAPLFRFLSRPEHKGRRERLTREIQAAARDADVLVSGLSAEQLKRLPFLQAVIQETLRVAPPLPFGLERRIPKGQHFNILGHYIPQGWDITVQSIAMSKSPDVFDDSLEWIPERWVDGRTEVFDKPQTNNSIRDMKQHFMAFGSGLRMCLGVNIAWTTMRGIVAGVYGCAQTEFEGKDKGEEVTELPAEGKRVDWLKITQL